MKKNLSSNHTELVFTTGDHCMLAEYTPTANGFADQIIRITTPNGWLKEVYTDEKGETTFEPIWDGDHVVELSYENKLPVNINRLNTNRLGINCRQHLTRKNNR